MVQQRLKIKVFKAIPVVLAGITGESRINGENGAHFWIVSPQRHVLLCVALVCPHKR